MTAPLCEFLEWDSDFFGKRIARLSCHRLTGNQLAAAESWCRANQIDCLYFLADADEPETARLAERNGFNFVDVRMTLERRLPEKAAEQTQVRLFRPQDEPVLRDIARRSHGDSRFYHDLRFPRARCEELYQIWIESSAKGRSDAVLVAEAAGVAAGYLSCHLSPSGVASIGLVAVAPECRGQGLGGHLIDASFEYFLRKGMKRVTVVTQGRNVPSQRLYQSRGFRTESVQLWYHRWFTDEVSA